MKNDSTEEIIEVGNETNITHAADVECLFGRRFAQKVGHSAHSAGKTKTLETSSFPTDKNRRKREYFKVMSFLRFGLMHWISQMKRKKWCELFSFCNFYAFFRWWIMIANSHSIL